MQRRTKNTRVGLRRRSESKADHLQPYRFGLNFGLIIQALGALGKPPFQSPPAALSSSLTEESTEGERANLEHRTRLRCNPTNGSYVSVFVEEQVKLEPAKGFEAARISQPVSLETVVIIHGSTGNKSCVFWPQRRLTHFFRSCFVMRRCGVMHIARIFSSPPLRCLMYRPQSSSHSREESANTAIKYQISSLLGASTGYSD